jgi:hypothetical protein
MANVYKTARGKAINIDKIKLSNEGVVAVGNMKVNARGDLLGAGGQVIAGRNAVMDRVYAIGDDGYSPHSIDNQPIMEAAGPQDLANLINNSIVPPTQDTTDAPAPAARGSLADSVAKQTTVTQEPIPNPKEQKKSNGPSRI